MIWVDNRFYPLAGRGEMYLDSVLISPWTGQAWARIDRGRGEWFAARMAAAGEKPWPLPESIPGSLFSDYDEWRWQSIRELPRPLLWREIQLVERWTSATLQCYNCPTQSVTEPSMQQSLMQEIAALRAKEAAGTLTDEELRGILRKMREGRVTASTVSAKSRAAKAPVDPDAALAEFLA